MHKVLEKVKQRLATWQLWAVLGALGAVLLFSSVTISLINRGRDTSEVEQEKESTRVSWLAGLGGGLIILALLIGQIRGEADTAASETSGT